MTPVVHFVQFLEPSRASDEHQCSSHGRVYRLDVHHLGGGHPQTYQGVFVPSELEPLLQTDGVVCLNFVEVPSNSIGMLALGPSVFRVMVGIGMADGTSITAMPQEWSSARRRRKFVSCAAATLCAALIGFSASPVAAAIAVASGICAFESRRQANELAVQPFKASVCYGTAPQFLSDISSRPVDLAQRNAVELPDATQEKSRPCMASLRAARTPAAEG